MRRTATNTARPVYDCGRPGLQKMLRFFSRAADICDRGRRTPHFVQVLFVVALIFGLGRTPTGSAQAKPRQNGEGDSQGLFLVARRELSDPFFAKSTVLMLPMGDSPLVVGLIVNKPTHISLHELFPDAGNLQKQGATAYFGGPVDIHDRSVIFRSPTPPEHALHIFADVYVMLDPSDVDALVKKNAKQASALHIFLGRSQWSRAQLRNEISEGAWYSLRDNADAIFAGDPAKVWQKLLDRAEPRPYVEYRQPFPVLFARRIPFAGNQDR